MGFEKLSKRKAIVCDSDDEDAITSPNGRKKTCQPCAKRTPLAPIDVDNIPDSDDEPLLPKAKEVGGSGPDFLGTPVSSKLWLGGSQQPVTSLSLRRKSESEAKTVVALRENRNMFEKVEQLEKVTEVQQAQKPSSFLATLDASRSKHVAAPASARSRGSGSRKFRHSLVSQGVQAADIREQTSSSKHRKSRHFPSSSVLDVDELASHPPGHSKRPEVALVIKKRWCQEIFEGSKIWEIRGSALTKRGRICIAQSKTKMLIGEVEVVDCLKVGRKVDGQLVPWSERQQHLQDFIGAPQNLPKHCVKDLSWVPYSKVFAWVLDKKVRYAVPQPYHHKPGCIQWVKLDPGPPGAQRGCGSSVAPPIALPSVAPVALRPATGIEPGGWQAQVSFGHMRFVDDDHEHVGSDVRLMDDDPDDPIEDVD